MIEIDLDARTISRVRLAVSPAADALDWLGLAADKRADPVFGRPGADAHGALADRDVALLAAVLPPNGRGYVPDFLTPKPGTGDGDVLAEQVEAVRETPAAVVHHQVTVERFGARAMPADVARSVADGTFAARAARAIAHFWRATLRDEWTNLKQVLDTDIAERSRTSSRVGVAGLIASLHPAVDCDGQTLRLRMPWTERGTLHDTELVLSPSLFRWPSLSAQLCSRDQAVLRYPTRGSGARRQAGRRQATAALIGATRTALLADLAVPRSTRALSERHHLSAATVSYHLGVLRDCALVVSSRQGHTVNYERTARAEALLR